MALQLITTGDGSHSLMNTELNETYHSVHGAVQESVHVFIVNGLNYYHQAHPVSSIAILEVGFGTGLNALLALDWAIRNNVVIHYTSLEAFPLGESIYRQLNYPELFQMDSGAAYFEKLHSVEWNTAIEVHPKFILEKRRIDLQEFEAVPGGTDVIFFDAFAPSRQPALWELPILTKMKDSLKPGGIFVTYCAKGQLKRDLKTLGLTVETLAGPPGKKEMVRGVTML